MATVGVKGLIIGGGTPSVDRHRKSTTDFVNDRYHRCV